MRVWVRPLGLILAAVASACGTGSARSPAAPSAVSLSVRLEAPGVLTGSTTTATATALTSAGAYSTVVPSWTSDRPEVATVSPAGVVAGVSPGSATILASYQGLSASATVAVTLNVTGSWQGTAQLESCDGFGNSRTCGRIAPPGTAAHISLTLTQDGPAVRGSLDLQTVPPPQLGPPVYAVRYVGELSGTVDSAGVLTLDGPTRRLPAPDLSVDAGEIRHWSTRVADGVQAGTFAQAFPDPLDTPPSTGFIRWTGVSLRRQEERAAMRLRGSPRRLPGARKIDPTPIFRSIFRPVVRPDPDFSDPDFQRASRSRIRCAAVTRAGTGMFRLASMTMPSLRVGTNAA